MEIQLGSLKFEIPDESWEEVTRYITGAIENDVELLRKYERGETITASFPMTLIDEEGEKKEIHVPLEVKKPLPLLGRVRLEIPEGGLRLEIPEGELKLKIPRLTMKKKVSLDEEKMIQVEEGVIEQAGDD